MRTPESKACDHCGEVRANAVLGDQVLSAMGREGKGLLQAAAKLIA
jgi:hypothetical protein